MTAAETFWQDKHSKYMTKEWSLLPNLFVEEVIEEIPTGARVLDLGAGTGRDSIFLAERGREVVAADFSKFALDHFAAEADRLRVEQVLFDLSNFPYPFGTSSFDVVYAHLSLHYMNSSDTALAFAEVGRVLRGGGRFLATFNSVRDPERGEGIEIESSFFELEPGDRKRYFTTEELPGLLGPAFHVLVCEYSTGTRKNAEDEVVRLVAVRA